MKLQVLFEDNHLLVVSKPAGLLSQGDATGRLSLLDIAKAYRREHESKPGNVFVGCVHRLDEPVSGVVVLAKTSKAAARLAEEFRSRRVGKTYLAAVEITSRAKPLPDTKIWTTWEDEIVRQEDDSRQARKQICTTRCRLLSRRGRVALLELQPISGRKHQLRIQTAKRGLPIIGDGKYGSKRTLDSGIALHAAEVQIAHPTKKVRMRFACSPPGEWDLLGVGLATGGKGNKSLRHE